MLVGGGLRGEGRIEGSVTLCKSELGGEFDELSLCKQISASILSVLASGTFPNPNLHLSISQIGSPAAPPLVGLHITHLKY